MIHFLCCDLHTMLVLGFKEFQNFKFNFLTFYELRKTTLLLNLKNSFDKALVVSNSFYLELV